VLGHVLVSPAHHQVHHSTARRHWDKNLGGIFALWDWLAGTLYVPRRDEIVAFGLGNGEDADYGGVLRLYVVPFARLWRRWRAWETKAARAAPSSL
jgi:sterol desaturase/sphingolipid hydroxylase (fatty acid hydroxylase superfamily)